MGCLQATPSSYHHSNHTALLSHLLSRTAPTPQQDILRLAGIQCQYSLRPQPVVQMWKLHHQRKMVLFHSKSTTLSKHSSVAESCAAIKGSEAPTESNWRRTEVCQGNRVSQGGRFNFPPKQLFDVGSGCTSSRNPKQIASFASYVRYCVKYQAWWLKNNGAKLITHWHRLHLSFLGRWGIKKWTGLAT